MKLKFPNGVTTFIDGTGQHHNLDHTGMVEVPLSQQTTIDEMKRAGFQEVMPEPEAVVEETTDAKKPDEEKPVLVPAAGAGGEAGANTGDQGGAGADGQQGGDGSQGEAGAGNDTTAGGEAGAKTGE